MGKIAAGLAAIGVSAATALIGPATPATAAAYRCRHGSFCFYEHKGGGGLRFTLRTSDSTFHNNPCAGCESSKNPASDDTWGDQASSYYNNSGETYCLYFDTDYDSLMLRINDRQRGNFGRRHNDEMSSAKPC